MISEGTPNPNDCLHILQPIHVGEHSTQLRILGREIPGLPFVEKNKFTRITMGLG